MGHVDDSSAYALTISPSGGVNMILVATNKGELTVLCQGFTTSTQLGGDFLIVFENGNLGGSTKFPRGQSIPETGVHHWGGIFKTTFAEEFQNLPPPEDNAVLEDRPNHMFLHPRYLIDISC
jgi:hypothetical protein